MRSHQSVEPHRWATFGRALTSYLTYDRGCTGSRCRLDLQITLGGTYSSEMPARSRILVDRQYSQADSASDGICQFFPCLVVRLSHLSRRPNRRSKVSREKHRSNRLGVQLVLAVISWMMPLGTPPSKPDATATVELPRSCSRTSPKK